MLVAPSFEQSVLVTDDPKLAAQISALFSRPNSYLPILGGPRMRRPDSDNEVVRSRNAMIRTGASNVLLGGLPSSTVSAIGAGWTKCTVSDRYCDHIQALRGQVKQTRGVLQWGTSNLGIGLYKARLSRKELMLDLDESPLSKIVEAGTHLLVACERGDVLAEVIASNLAFACNASFLVFEELEQSNRENWIEKIYSLGEGGDLTGQLDKLTHQARNHLGEFDFTKYKNVLFITAGFPWGIAIHEVASTHMYRYPDLGRAVIDGIWSSQGAGRSARNALLVDPQAVDSSEISTINNALLKNGTLTRVVQGKAATQVRIQSLLDLLPYDIIVFSSHAGDAPGVRVTYEYPDDDDRKRTLVVDNATGIGYDPLSDMYRVVDYHRFHSLDGVDWQDKAGLAGLPVGTAMTAWVAIDKYNKHKNYIVSQETISRVKGSMAIQLHDGIWLFTSHGFAPGSAPVFINNSCWSWHELSQRTTFAGARAYVGTLFPITDAEAQEANRALFGRYIGQELHRALWRSQKEIYGATVRRPYVMIGLPFIAIRNNIRNSVSYMVSEYRKGIKHWKAKTEDSLHDDVRQNAKHFGHFLEEDLKMFLAKLQLGRTTPR